MKKTIIFLSLLFSSFFSFGQLTMQSFTPPTNGQPYQGQFDLLTSAGYYTADPGTNVYHQYIFESAIGLDRHIYIIRQNNAWKILERQHSGGMVSNYIQYEAINSKNEIDPPCDATWKTVGSGSSRTVKIFLSGNTCSPVTPPTSSIVISPSGLSLPKFTEIEISLIDSPEPGTMVWSIDEALIMYFNGSVWVEL